MVDILRKNVDCFSLQNDSKSSSILTNSLKKDLRMVPIQLGDPRFKHPPMNLRIQSDKTIQQIRENTNQVKIKVEAWNQPYHTQY